MPLFTYPPAPFVLAAPGYEDAAVNATAVTAGAAFLIAVTLMAPVTITQMRCNMSGSPTGNIDMAFMTQLGRIMVLTIALAVQEQMQQQQDSLQKA